MPEKLEEKNLRHKIRSLIVVHPTAHCTDALKTPDYDGWLLLSSVVYLAGHLLDLACEVLVNPIPRISVIRELGNNAPAKIFVAHRLYHRKCPWAVFDK